MIIVTGATGHLGRAIVEKLLERVSADQLGASTRDPQKASDLAARGVRVRRGDFEDAASLQQAFEGAGRVMIVSSNARSRGGDPLAQHRRAIEAARAAGAQRVFYTSHMAAGASSAFAPMHDHAATEAMLSESGLAWTALRNGFYGSSGLDMMGSGLQSGELAAPADGAVSWTTHADLAEAAAILLSETDSRYDGPTPPLVASQALDFADLAGIASQVGPKPVHRQRVTDEAFRQKMTAAGTPEPVVNMMLGFYLAARNGEFAANDPTLQQLLGRAPLGMRELMARKLKG